MAKGKCINIGKPCNLAISEEIQDADPANFVCKECGKPLVAVEGATEGSTGDGRKPNKKRIIGICVLAAAAIGGGIWWWNSKQSDKTDEVVPVDDEIVIEQEERTDTIVPDTIAPEPEPEKPEAPQGGQDPQPANPNYLNNYALAYGTYSGPAEGGVPNGPGGTVTVTKAYQLDLKAGGEMLELRAGDTIVNCKFRNGKIVQGFLKRKNGQGRNFNIGI